MNNSSKVSPREIYQGRIVARQMQVTAWQRQHVLLGYVRLVLVIAGIAVGWFSFYEPLLSRWWLAGDLCGICYCGAAALCSPSTEG